MEVAVAGAVVGAGSLPQAGKAAHEGGKSEIGLGLGWRLLRGERVFW